MFPLFRFDPHPLIARENSEASYTVLNVCEAIGFDLRGLLLAAQPVPSGDRRSEGQSF